MDGEGGGGGGARGAAEWGSDAVLAFLRRCLGKAKPKKNT